MLGSIGNPSMLVEDSPIRAYVYLAQDAEGAVTWDNKMPIYEFATGDESNIVTAPGRSVSVLSPVARALDLWVGENRTEMKPKILPLRFLLLSLWSLRPSLLVLGIGLLEWTSFTWLLSPCA